VVIQRGVKKENTKGLNCYSLQEGNSDKMKPTKRTPVLQNFLETLGSTIYGRSLQESIKKRICVACGKPALTFVDAKSKEEYYISGFCQKCQDRTFTDLQTLLIGSA